METLEKRRRNVLVVAIRSIGDERESMYYIRVVLTQNVAGERQMNMKKSIEIVKNNNCEQLRLFAQVAGSVPEGLVRAERKR